MGWPGATGTNAPPGQVPGGPSLFGAPSAPNLPSGGTPVGNAPTSTPNPFGFSNASNQGSIARNTQMENLLTAEDRNALIPFFTQMMSGSAGPAMDFFKQLMNLGSPYYAQQQRASLEQGVNQGQNAAAGANQRLAASGYGYAPSGLQAGMLGQEATGQAQNLSQMFLQNLFQNENMQALGAQGLTSIASLFNPSNLTGQQTGFNQFQAPTFASQFQQIMNGLFGQGGAAGGAATGQQMQNTCYVAAELYGGWEAPETISIRAWLARTREMQGFVRLYNAIGEAWAELIRYDSTARRLTKQLFDAFLRESWLKAT